MPRIHALNGLISQLEADLDIELDASSLESRIRIQKLLYFAQEYGADFNYTYSMYIHGPYSPELAEDYYSDDFRETEGRIPGELDYANFVGFVEGKSNDWLELASTIHKLYATYRQLYSGDELVAEIVRAAASKKNVSSEAAEDVYTQLRSEGLLD